MNNILRYLWFLCIVRPLVLFAMGVHILNRERLLSHAPAIIVANHNSHLDAMVLTSLFPLKRFNKIRPVAAADYFLRNRWLAWFALNIIGIIPLRRHRQIPGTDPLTGCARALEQGDILVLFPEGSRGEPEQLMAFRTGIAHLAKRFPSVPVIPVFMQGLGKALPRGEWIPVPVTCDVVVGEPLYWTGTRRVFMENLESRIKVLAEQVRRPVLE